MEINPGEAKMFSLGNIKTLQGFNTEVNVKFLRKLISKPKFLLPAV